MFATVLLTVSLLGQAPPGPVPDTPGWHWAVTPEGHRPVYGWLREGRVYPAPAPGPVLGPTPITITVPPVRPVYAPIRLLPTYRGNVCVGGYCPQ